MHKMRKSGVTANVISLTAAISACEKGGQWEQALRLLHKMSEIDVIANVISLAAAISAHEKGSHRSRS